jgi:hypothetical protein
VNEEIILNNLEIIRKYLGKSGVEFSNMFGKEGSYYRKIIIYKKTLPSLDFIVRVCEYCHIKIDRFLNEKLELQLIFEGDKE